AGPSAGGPGHTAGRDAKASRPNVLAGGFRMSVPSQANPVDFWDLLHAALGLQHGASRLAEAGSYEDASYYERQAIALLLEATCLLDTEQPALQTVRQLATAGLARLHDLKRRVRQAAPAPSRATVSPRRSRHGA